MSTIKDALEAIRDAVKLVDEVKRSTERITDLTVEVRDIDRRVARLEGKCEAAIVLGMLSAATKPRALPSSKKHSDE